MIDLDAATPFLVEFEPKRLAIALVGHHRRSRRPLSESLATHALLHGSPALRASISDAVNSWMSHLDKRGNLDRPQWTMLYDLVRTRVGQPHRELDQDPSRTSVELAGWVGLLKYKPKDLRLSDVTELLQLSTAYASVARTRGDTWAVLMDFLKAHIDQEPEEVGRFYAALVHAQFSTRSPGFVFENPSERSFLEEAVKQRATWTELANAQHAYLSQSLDLYVDLFGAIY